jgi:hypothetical protein
MDAARRGSLTVRPEVFLDVRHESASFFHARARVFFFFWARAVRKTKSALLPRRDPRRRGRRGPRGLRLRDTSSSALLTVLSFRRMKNKKRFC